jgi:ferredoxin
MSENFIPTINLSRCDRCGRCISICPEEALYLNEDGPAFVQPITCTYCTDCEAVCPHQAIRAPLTVAWASEA